MPGANISRAVGGTLLVLAAALAPVCSVAAQEPEPSAILLLTPTPVEDAASWGAVVRALRALGRRAVQVADVSIDPVYAACRASACARKAAQAAKLPAALFSLESGLGGEPELTLRLYGPDGSQVALRTEQSSLSIEQSALVLFERAQRQLSLGDAALLQVVTRPAGALVSLDGEPMGVGPVERSVREGVHLLRVSSEGFHVQEGALELHAGRVQSVEVKLRRAPSGDARALADGAPMSALREDSPWNFILGGALAIASLPLLISSVNALANDGRCFEARASGCTNRADFGPRSAAVLGAGAVALLGGGFFLIARPLQLSVDAGPSGAGLRLRGRL